MPPSAATADAPLPIGGIVATASAAEQAAELRERLEEREAAWRAAHPDHPADEPLPEEVKRRDVVWRALERKQARAEAAAAAEDGTQ